jgi:uncharacterized protein YceK
MNYKKKSNLAIVLMVALAVLLIGCVAVFQTDSSENSDISGNEENSTLLNATVSPSETPDENETEGS